MLYKCDNCNYATKRLSDLRRHQNKKRPCIKKIEVNVDNLEEGFSINVEEGDILFFPCHFAHRSNKSNSKQIKTIISWNLDFIDMLDKHVNKDNNIKIYE